MEEGEVVSQEEFLKLLYELLEYAREEMEEAKEKGQPLKYAYYAGVYEGLRALARVLPRMI